MASSLQAAQCTYTAQTCGGRWVPCFRPGFKSRSAKLMLVAALASRPLPTRGLMLTEWVPEMSCIAVQVRLQYYPDGYEWAEELPVLISEGYSGHAAGVSGRQALPTKFNVSRNQSVQGIFLNRQIVSEWADEKVPSTSQCRQGLPEES